LMQALAMRARPSTHAQRCTLIRIPRRPKAELRPAKRRCDVRAATIADGFGPALIGSAAILREAAHEDNRPSGGSRAADLQPRDPGRARSDDRVLARRDAPAASLDHPPGRR